MGGIAVSFVNTTTFTVATDLTTDFNTGRRVRLTATSGYLYGNISSSSYSSPNTTVILTASSDNLDSSISIVYYGISADSLGSLPTHTHDAENEGGTFSILNMSDVPAAYDTGKFLQSTTSGTIWISGAAGTLVHSELSNLDFSSSGHTGFAETAHTHTESDVTDLDKYTQNEVDTISGTLSDEIDSDIATHTSNSDAHHSESHTVVSHSDTTATGANLNELVGNGDTTLHKHDTLYYTETEVDTISGSLQTNIDNSISDTEYGDGWNGITTIAPSKNVIYDKIDTLSRFHDYTESPILVSGGEFSEGTVSGTLKVTAITALLRDEDSETGTLVYVTKAEEDNIDLPAQDTIYLVVLNYNGGTPTISLEQAYPNLTQNINIGIVLDNTDICSFMTGEGGFRLHDFPQRVHLRNIELRAAELASGSVPSYTGTNNFTMTAGVIYSGINRAAWGSYASITDKFVYIYRSNGDYTYVIDQTAIDCAHYDDGDGTLGTVGVSKYGVHWVYRTFEGCVFIVYGYGGNYNLEQAEDATAPNVPDFISAFGLLIGKIVVPQAGGSFTTIQMVTDVFFSGTAVSTHNDLGGLNEGDYKHLTAANHTDLTDSGDCSIHKHDDRYYTESEVDTISGTLYDSAVKYTDTPTYITVNNDETIQSVIEGITDATANKPYTVIVPPGVYTERITMKDYISLNGSGIKSTTISYAHSAGEHGTIILADNISVSNMTVIATGASSGMCFVPPARAATFYIISVYMESSFDSFWAKVSIIGDYAFTAHFIDCHHKIYYDAITSFGTRSNAAVINLYNNNIEIADTPTGSAVRGICIESTNTKVFMHGGRIFGNFNADIDSYGIKVEDYIPVQLMGVDIDMYNSSTASVDMFGANTAAGIGSIKMLGCNISVDGTIIGTIAKESGEVSSYGSVLHGTTVSLSADGTFTQDVGTVHKVDPNGASRNYIPVSAFTDWSQLTIINTADADETITFDPIFTVAGTHDGGNGSPFLYDSGEAWVENQLAGKTINNTTDGSSGICVRNTTTIIYVTLSGGTDNDWDTGDTYTITPVGLNQTITQNESGIFVYDGTGWLKINNEIPTTLLELDDTPSSYDNNKYLKSTTSGTEWATVSGGTGTSVHSELSNLDYASSGHTGFQPSGDYATDSELTSVSGVLQTNIDGKANTVHTHDDRYYTESETDTISGSLQSQIDNKSDTGHIHDDRYYTESEVDTISGSLNTKIDTKADSGANSDITSMTGLDDDGIPGAKVVAASSTAEGVSELAIASEINTGTDTARTITPDALAGSIMGTKNVVVKCIADDTALTTGDGKAYFTVPIELNGMNLVSVGAHVYTVSSSGLPTFQIHNLTDTVDMLSTVITIDANEKDSKDAATPAEINTANDDVATGDELRFDCDVAGTGTKGFEIRTGFRLP